MFKDYYKILGIHRQASAQEIKSAYRAMSIKWHPDKNPNVNVTSIMQDINEAYAILKDEEKRICTTLSMIHSLKNSLRIIHNSPQHLIQKKHIHIITM